MKTAIALISAATAGIALLALSERAARRWTLLPETGRKVAHVASGMLAATFPFFLPFPAIVGLAAAFVPFMIVSRRLKLFPVLQMAERATLGEVYFPLGVLLVAALVPHKAEYVFGVLVMGLGDAFASLIGQRFGRRSYDVLSAHKTYVGSAALFVTTSLLGVLTLTAAGKMSGAHILVV